MSRIGSLERQKGISGCQGRGWDWGMMAGQYRISFWADENVLKLGYGDDCTTL